MPPAFRLLSFISVALRSAPEYLFHIDGSLFKRFFFQMRVDVRRCLVVGVADDSHCHKRVDTTFVDKRHVNVIVPEAVRRDGRLELMKQGRLGQSDAYFRQLLHAMTTAKQVDRRSISIYSKGRPFAREAS